MTIRQILENLSEENSEIVNYRPEDYDYFINKFVDGKEKLEGFINKNEPFNHLNNNMILTFEKLKTTLLKSYYIKEKAHQNTSLIKEKHNQLTKAITDYNQVLNSYKIKTGKDIQTIGNMFNQFYKKDTKGKGSVNTEV